MYETLPNKETEKKGRKAPVLVVESREAAKRWLCGMHGRKSSIRRGGAHCGARRRGRERRIDEAGEQSQPETEQASVR